VALPVLIHPAGNEVVMPEVAECLGPHGAVAGKTGGVEVGVAVETLQGVIERVGSVDHLVDLLGRGFCLVRSRPRKG
jgi:hypothetical protein